MIDRSELTPVLKRVVVDLVNDLRERADTVDEVGDIVRAEYAAAQVANRTAHDLGTWREGLLAQVAVSWVLGCVFIRFCVDNGLVTKPMLSGRGEWRRWAIDSQSEYFRSERHAGERAYLLHVFNQARELPGLNEVFGSHNPLWQFGPSDDACRALIQVWRDIDVESGELAWDFADTAWDTRFLGDLYQDLSEHAKKNFALLQTPEFVEEFILDRTLDPAIDEFGLTGHDGSGFRMIDPACGSGHFLLGGFDRLAHRWLERDPAAGRRAAAARALQSVVGVDINPFAAAIARFRLLVAALRFAEVRTLAEAPEFEINVAVGDSLLHGPAPGRLVGQFDLEEWRTDAAMHLYATEDAETVGRFLAQDYHAVVANPPYITPKDPAANRAYRDRYDTCSGKYSLSVPFMERLFDLAVRGAGTRRAGFVGQITSNSFMKREFGAKVIEQFLVTSVDLTHVIDTGGAYLPGHGTPTVILFGRNRSPVGENLRAVLGIRGEPSIPADPALGLVWSSITAVIDRPGAEDEFVSSVDISRAVLAHHPWSLQGGAAAPLKSAIESGSKPLEGIVESIGITAVTGEDSVFVVGDVQACRRLGLTSTRRLIVGDEIRDWLVNSGDQAVWAYDDEFKVIDPADLPGHLRHLWRYKTAISSRKRFGTPMLERGLAWHEWQEIYPAKLRTPLSIACAAISTHNNFVLDRGGSVFKQSAPVIKLANGEPEERHLELLGLLNSSTACFWMKQVFQPKPSNGVDRGLESEAWTVRSDIDSTKLLQFPVREGHTVLPWSEALDRNASALASCLPATVANVGIPTAEALRQSSDRTAELRGQMVWLQEELDWRCMFVYGITSTDLSFSPDRAFALRKGERAFEIALARRVDQGSTTTEWFRRHQSVRIVEPPNEWPEWYRERVEQRIEMLDSDRFVELLERPEYKRRWNWETWDDLAGDALRDWMLSRLEDPRYWPGVEPRSVAQLADVARLDGAFVQVAELYRKSTEVDYADLVGQLVAGEAVPFVAACRYETSGLRKRAAWERIWDLQRRDDEGQDVGKIPLPPKYSQSDFRSPVIWTVRGKLDVPRERFISYPCLERDSDTTAVVGWAGWDHLGQAKALVALYQHRRDQDGWPADRLAPILAGLAELIPWLRQWHNHIDPDLGIGLGDYFADYLAGETHRNGLSPDDLAGWRPPEKAKRTRKKKAAT